jgi:protein-S-isoprenylcysteine O-methyltransferase Ste14
MLMSAAVLVLVAFNLAVIAALPLVVFEKRDGRLGPMWWITAAPFFVLPLFIALPRVGYMVPLVANDGPVGRALAILAVVPSTLSIALIMLAITVHQARASLWHQEHDLPPVLVTKGPYTRVRHPFYLAFLLMFLAAVALVPNAGTIGALICAAILLGHTAAREERRLCTSHFGPQYKAYIARSGRFLPPLLRYFR